jgi:excisionase family DNA binding protein
MDLFYTTGQMAGELKVSDRTIRNLCTAGIIKASRSPGGHFRIDAVELQRLKQLESLPAIPRATISGNGARQGKRNPNELLAEPSTEVIESAEDAFVSDRQLVTDKNRLEQMRVHKEAMEIRDFFTARQKAQQDEELEEERREAELEEKRTQERRAEIAAEQRQRFCRRWFTYAIEQKPFDGPDDYALLIKPEVLATLAEIQPDESDSIVRSLVDAAIARRLKPWYAAEGRRRAQRDAINRALSSLPFQMKWDDSWQARARKIACEAVDGASEDTTESDMAMIAELALRPLTAEYTHDERIHGAMKFVFLSNANSEEQEDAREAVKTALAALPISASDRQVERAKENALMPIRERIATRLQRQHDEDNRKAMLARLESRLAWRLSGEERNVATAAATAAMEALPPGASIEQREKAGQAVVDRHVAKGRLIETGSREVYRHAQKMLLEFDYDDRETASQLEGRIRSQVESALRNELDGTEDPEDIIEMVHEIMEEIEGCERS